MRLELSVQGAESTVRVLRVTAESLNKPLRPLLEVLAGEMQSAFQRHIQQEQGPQGPFPELKPETRAIRRWYGHPPDSPKLVRAGDLLHSITTLELGEDSFNVGSRLPYARIVQEGGTITDEHGRTRTVQAFPFVYVTAQEKDDLFALIQEYFLGGADA